MHRLIGCLSGLLFAANATGQNLVLNADFDAALAPWSTADGTLVWDPGDYRGNPQSGSLSLINERSLPGVVIAVAQHPCINVTEPGRYEFGSRYLLAANENPLNYGSVNIDWSAGPCPRVGGQATTRGAQVRGAWDSAWGVIDIDDAMVANGAAAVEIRLLSIRLSADDRFEMLYDGVWLHPEGTPLFANGFE